MHEANTASARALKNFVRYQYHVVTIAFFFLLRIVQLHYDGRKHDRQ